jgi:hypothetical protein
MNKHIAATPANKKFICGNAKKASQTCSRAKPYHAQHV